MKYKSIALFCGSATGENPLYAQEAAEFGRRVAEKGITLYYGGVKIGLMNAAANAVMANNGTAIGIAPAFFEKSPIIADNVTELIFVKTMSERKQLFEKHADAFVAFPGGFGTMDELFEILTDAQLGLHYKPIAIYNPNGYYDLLWQQIEQFSKEGFLLHFHKDLLIIAETLDELFDKLDHYENTNDHDWLQKVKP